MYKITFMRFFFSKNVYILILNMILFTFKKMLLEINKMFYKCKWRNAKCYLFLIFIFIDFDIHINSLKIKEKHYS